ncbi:hypothetical protein ACFFN5_15795, partial [Streptomonospora salina]
MGMGVAQRECGVGAGSQGPGAGVLGGGHGGQSGAGVLSGARAVGGRTAGGHARVGLADDREQPRGGGAAPGAVDAGIAPGDVAGSRTGGVGARGCGGRVGDGLYPAARVRARQLPDLVGGGGAVQRGQGGGRHGRGARTVRRAAGFGDGTGPVQAAQAAQVVQIAAQVRGAVGGGRAR